MVRKHDSSTRVLTFVLTVAFGLLSAVIAYASFKGGSFELRSKAVTEEVILKQWTFDKVAEGWNAKDFLSSTVSGGMYKLTVNSNKQIAESKQECTTNPKQKKQVCKQVRVMRDLSPRLVNTSVQTNLLYPINKFRIRLLAGSLQSTKIFPKPTQQVYPFILKVSQKYQGKKVSETEQQISAVADAKEHEYTFDFPKDSSLKRVDELQIAFVGLGIQAGTFVSINDIALIGMKEVVPTPTKKPPEVTQTLTGYVRTYPGEGSLLYKLTVSPAVIGNTKSIPSQPVYGKPQEYLLTQNIVNPCGTSKTSKMMCRYFAPAKIDFSKYVDKYVTVIGSILKQDEATIGFGQDISPEKEVSTQAKWMIEDDAIINRPGQQGLPTFVVSTIKLVTNPSISPSPVVSKYPSPPSECYYESVQCVKAPCNPILVCPPSPEVSQYPTATPWPAELQPIPVYETSCQGVVDAMVNVAPLKVTSSISLNWGGMNEKWFMDRNNAWYYMYEDNTAGPSGSPPQYLVVRWKNNDGLSAGSKNTKLDEPVTSTNASCYNAITANYTFPLPISGPFAVTPTLEVQCKTVVTELAKDGSLPLKVVNNNIFFNWGGVNEKWFQDIKNRWYYIYPIAESNDVAVRRWNNGINNTPNIADDFDKDSIVSPENIECYNAISSTYIFSAQ